MKKKFIGVMLAGAIGVSTLFSGCNAGLGIGSYYFDKAHVQIGEDKADLHVITWQDNEGAGIEVNTEEYGPIFLSEGTYVLFSGDVCPLCGDSE